MTLDEMIARIRQLPGMAKRAAPDVAAAIELELRHQISEGRDPDGKRWAPKQEGGQALVNAANHLFVAPIGTRVLAVLKGPTAMHSRGIAKGGLQRQILPDTKRIPLQMRVAIQRVLDEHFKRAMRVT